MVVRMEFWPDEVLLVCIFTSVAVGALGGFVAHLNTLVGMLMILPGFVGAVVSGRLLHYFGAKRYFEQVARCTGGRALRSPVIR